MCRSVKNVTNIWKIAYARKDSSRVDTVLYRAPLRLNAYLKYRVEEAVQATIVMI